MMSERFSLQDTQQLMRWFEALQQSLPELPIKYAERNSTLRPEILKRVISEFLTDDERAALLGLPEGCRIREGAKIISPANLKIGEYCWVGENAVLDASGGLEIGSHTSIGLSVFVWTHSSHLTNLSMHNEMASELIQRKTTKIGNGCFIGGPSVILPGVTIGDNVLVRPFTTVAKDIPSRSLVDPSGVKEGIFTELRINRMIRKQMGSQE
jgi:acetyltransferase-like isoleucine patch superfamily enzyme